MTFGGRLFYCENPMASNPPQESMKESIRGLNKAHYATETNFYTTAPLRPIEQHLVTNLSTSARILDVGCGAARVTAAMTRMGFRITGVDVVRECLESARRSFPELSLDLVEGDMCKLPFDDGEFNEVLCLRFSFNALGTEEERFQALHEMVRVCAPGGRILVESFNRLYPGKLGLMWLANFADEVSRSLRIAAGSLSPRLPKGDILYLASKDRNAVPGYAHLPTPLELKRIANIIPSKVHFEILSAEAVASYPEVFWKRWFGYSIWLRGLMPQ